MNPLCSICEVLMRRNVHRNEYYCPKCGLVVEGFNFMPAYEEGRGPFVPAWMANLPQTLPAHRWVGGRCLIKGLTCK